MLRQPPPEYSVVLSRRKSYQNILGGLLLELWDARAGTAFSGSAFISWTGLIRGITFSAPAVPQRPNWAADGANFNGRNVVQCATSGTKCLKVAGLSGFMPAGSRPWIFGVARYRTLGAGGAFPALYDFGGAASDLIITSLTPGGAGSSLRAYWSPTVVTGPAADTNVHGTATWLDGTNENLSVDGSNTSGANAAALSADITNIAIGNGVTTDAVCSNTSHAMRLVCSQYPGAAAAAAVLALAKADWSF